MFQIVLSPQFSNDVLKIRKHEDTLTINGTTYDFSSLNNGDEVPIEAIFDENIIGNITKNNGIINITVRMPYSDADAPEGIRFPQPIELIEDGEIVFNEKVATDD